MRFLSTFPSLCLSSLLVFIVFLPSLGFCVLFPFAFAFPFLLSLRPRRQSTVRVPERARVCVSAFGICIRILYLASSSCQCCFVCFFGPRGGRAFVSILLFDLHAVVPDVRRREPRRVPHVLHRVGLDRERSPLAAACAHALTLTHSLAYLGASHWQPPHAPTHHPRALHLGITAATAAIFYPSFFILCVRTRTHTHARTHKHTHTLLHTHTHTHACTHTVAPARYTQAGWHPHCVAREP